MSKKLELQVNVVNQFLLFRNNMFADKIAFIDELVQNAQRARATKLDVMISRDKIEFRDNGVGLSDPRNLFTMSQSGWDEETQESQSPFGLGFFSVVMAADMIGIETVSKVDFKKRTMKFDVLKLIEEKRRDVIDYQEEDQYGLIEEPYFKVTLTQLRQNVIDQLDSIRERLTNIALFAHDLTISSNETVLSKKDLSITDGSKYAIPVENDEVKGWLRPSDWSEYGSTSKVILFYQGREICALKYPFEYLLGGELHLIRDNILTLRVPDRKGIIEDDRYTVFRNNLYQLGRQVARNLVINGIDTDIKKYEAMLEKFLKPEDYNELIKVKVFVSSEDYELVDKVILALKRGKDIKSLSEILRETEDSEEISKKISDLITFTSKEIEEVSELASDEDLILDLAIKRGPAGQTSGFGSGGSPIESTTQKLVKKAERTDMTSMGNLAKMGLIYWVEIDQSLEYEEKASLAAHYKIPLVLASTKVEILALKANNISHISEMNTIISAKARLKRLGPIGAIEHRAAYLLSLVSVLCGGEKDDFKLGDLNIELRINLEDGPKLIETKTAIAAYCPDEDKILVDRSSLRVTNLSGSSLPAIRPSDRKYILCNLVTLVEQLKLKYEDIVFPEVIDKVLQAIA